MFYLNPEIVAFPHPSYADREGILAVGGSLSQDMLMLAYTYGVFPWYNPDEAVLWWHPPQRFVIPPAEVKVAKSMRSYFNKEKYRITIDTCFLDVMLGCKTTERVGQGGTWITTDFIDAYVQLHEKGYAHSVEVWDGDDLCGGLYGVSLGNVFCGESMFSRKSNASKFALICIARILEEKGFSLIDCQMPTPHLESMGGRFISRDSFLDFLRESMKKETIRGSWSFMAENLDYKNIL